jgi:hypothetical protein
MDFCLVIKDGNEEEAKERLIKSFNENGFHTSDIDPIGTIEKMYRISNRLKTGYVPTEFVPIDTHLFTYSELSKLMGKLEPEIERALSADRAPYVPTFPDSLRKTWQKDDTAINFFYDYMYSFTEYDFDSELAQQLKETRKSIVTKYTNEQLEKMVLEAGPESQRRRYQCPTLKLRFNERMDSWRKE